MASPIQPYLRSLFRSALSLVLIVCLAVSVSVGEEIDQNYYDLNIRPILKDNCFKCHGNKKSRAGVNLEKYETIVHIFKDGERWLEVFDQIEAREMPPKKEPALGMKDYQTLVDGIDALLKKSLKVQNPGRVVARRMSHSEYQYTVEDLLGVKFDAKKHFPRDGSGGGGFDNQARALFMSPLKLERYYEATELIVNELSSDENLWKKVVPNEYRVTFWQKIGHWIMSLFVKDFQPDNTPEIAAKKVIVPLASKAYRRYLRSEEEDRLIGLFSNVYQAMDSLQNPVRFNFSIAQSIKAIFVSPNFLYRVEEENDKDTPFELSDFELASRLSYFLWCSVPDDELLQLANEEMLQDSLILEHQVKRMLEDPRSERFAKVFSSQWFGINKLIENTPIADPEKFPEFTPAVRQAMYDEAISYFNHVLKESRDFMDLINSDYTFLNQELAQFYNLPPVEGEQMRKVTLDDRIRGGILGMGGILTVSSLPTRTSPVLRGKWVLEEILGTPPPPPPPNAGELPEDEAAHKDVGLRKLLEIHRSKPGCQSCHEKMDPLGLGLENFDAIGRWRESYGEVDIDASGVLTNGEAFNGPAELKQLLEEEKEKFARNLSKKMLSYALGRSVKFNDEPTVRKLEACLLENDFDTEKFISTLVKSYTFRLKSNDQRKKKAA
ncbi:MAG: DUF1592 domain-containing protein [Cyclobacteriaceae bacterium]